MNLILQSLNYSPELTGIGKYNGEMCPELVKRDLNVTAVVAPPYYPEWQVHNGFNAFTFSSSEVEGVNVIRCPLYVPKNVTTIKRVIHLGSFAISSFFALISQLFKKPDVIMLVQPTLFCAPFTLLYAKLTGAKTVMHIQDYEVDALFGLGLMTEGKVSRFVKRIESWLMKRFDAVSTISYSMIENAKRKGVDESKIIHFPNWSDTDFVTPQTCGEALKKEWGFKPTDKIVLYAGNIGNKQGLEVVLDAAKHYQTQPNVKFVLVGAGAYVDTLKANANQLNLNNVVFLPLQPWEKVPQMLALADVHLVVQKKGAADAVLPSKLTNILSAGGHALITAEPHTELGQIANKHTGIYDCVEPENTAAFIEGLELILSRDLTTHNLVARQFAETYLAKNKILDQFVTDLNKLTNNNL
ncbi:MULTISPECIES: WcaI family glycosyltransferase [unclassified Pseudoalteromonas]|uniref:WcaI family glycosyltransferase n=1 Tax=unclassified Pseudoalteromonas TaxID=194690 RepID=UPI001109ABD4|nr:MULTISPECIES: WcaI family glycosyltransferase [unclassified Pseudoalteromonas]TMN81311.1 colanic acid biosynthesis glycosyltransferase WcaI [Pseudoalteromonas sp. S410]TMN89292.1 colanic acid biosynthesis glycosyltransferase WcaI [Pseudoalteromonas sp. S408]TMN95070.1 colanic acid biosynthesis glycosyltransferase WcaI [Pseudoalteromonas sp. S407]TMN96537.1 colanic acid biosynthesis glycosyltransferase WcaI [Pseudoalteromonas sp. S409]TMO07792.1 colanic acid biosynthesis glycosyltransferase 